MAAVGFLSEIKAAVNVVDASRLGAGKTRVRVVHAAPDAPAVDVGVAGGDTLFADLVFPNASRYRELAAGTYDLEVRLDGTDDVVLPLPHLTLTAGTVYDVYAIGLVGDGSFTVLPLTTATGAVRMPHTGVGSSAADAGGSGWTIAVAALAAGAVGGGLLLRRRVWRSVGGA